MTSLCPFLFSCVSIQTLLRKTLLKIALILTAAYSVVVGLMFLRQDSLIFFPEKDILLTPKNIHCTFSDVQFITKDNILITGWFIPSPRERGVVLFCHGNAGNISHRLDSIKIFNDLHMSVLIFDYRGYGKTQGKPSEKGTYYDGYAAWDYLVNTMNKRPENIVVFGRSLGGAVAAEIARIKHPAGLIIESTFTSIPDLGAQLYPWLPVRFISKYEYATIEKISAIQCPKLIIHSPQDEIIPFEHGRAIYAQASHPKAFLEITGSHNEGFLMSGSVYKDGLNMFFGQVLPR